MTPELADRAGDSVLGSLLFYYTQELVTVVQATGLVWSDFRHERQQVVYRAVLRVHRDGGHVDSLTVEAFLTRHGWLGRAGGAVYLAVLASSAVPSAVKEHARVVAEHARQNRLVAASEHLNKKARAWDDPEGLREAFAWVSREMREPEAETKLRVVGEKAA